MAELKFTEDEIAKVKSLQDDFNTIVLQLGQLNVEELNLQRAQTRITEAKKSLEAKYQELVTKERQIAEELNKKYGAGTLDPRTGVFTPTQTSNQ